MTFSSSPNPPPVHVAGALQRLEASGLIRLAEALPELAYLFRHALVQDAAYASLLKADRKRLHLTVGEALEHLYAGQLDELAPRLAQHFAEAGDARALPYFTRAGDTAARRYANVEAVEHYTRALELAAPDAENSQVLDHLYTRLGRALEMLGRYAEAMHYYQDMESLARQRDDRALELAALIAQATLRCAPTTLHDADAGRDLCDQALALARALGARAAEARVLWNLVLLNKFVGHFPEAIAVGEQAMALARELDLRELLAYILNDIHMAYLATGQAAPGLAALDEAQVLWRRLGNQAMLADTLNNLASVYYMGGNIDRALATADEAYEISLAIGNLWNQAYSRWQAGEFYFGRGELGKTISALQIAIELGEQSGFAGGSVMAGAVLAGTYLVLGALEPAFAAARTALSAAEQHMRPWRPIALATLAIAHAMQGDLGAAGATLTDAYGDLPNADFSSYLFMPPLACEVLVQLGDYARVVAIADEFVSLVRENGARAALPEGLFHKGCACLALGRLAEAEACLAEARAEAEAQGKRVVLWRIVAAQAKLAAAQGDTARAEALRAQARPIVAFIATHAGTPELSASFLDQPEVRAVMESGDGAS